MGAATGIPAHIRAAGPGHAGGRGGHRRAGDRVQHGAPAGPDPARGNRRRPAGGRHRVLRPPSLPVPGRPDGAGGQPARPAAGLAGADPAERDPGRLCPQLRRGLGRPPARGARPAAFGRAGRPAGGHRRAAVGHPAHPLLMARRTAAASQPDAHARSAANDAASRIAAWQRRAGRHGLPWQQTRDPYRIWLSEIMLQQTQAATVVPYYERFLDLFPTVVDLADAAQDAVLHAWAGLGYYARARNLHRCAQVLRDAHGGRFPATAEELARLPGIGPSTAAAIAAFAYGERAPILDGNVRRVLSRYFAVEGDPTAARTLQRLWA